MRLWNTYTKSILFDLTIQKSVDNRQHRVKPVFYEKTIFSGRYKLLTNFQFFFSMMPGGDVILKFKIYHLKSIYFYEMSFIGYRKSNFIQCFCDSQAPYLISRVIIFYQCVIIVLLVAGNLAYFKAVVG